MADLMFSVRPLQQGAQQNTLRGAFRLHMSPEALTTLGLKLGEVCTVVAEDGTSGSGIAWRAADKLGSNPKTQPVKMSETMREAFGFKQGSQAKIEKALKADVCLATRVVVTEIAAPEETSSDDKAWTGRCYATLLLEAEAFAEGTIFDVKAAEGPRRKYLVESIESNDPHDAHSLFRMCDDTVVSISDGSVQQPQAASLTNPAFTIDTAYIGGLTQQVNELHEQLRLLCQSAKRQTNKIPSIKTGVLISGYEGTGKSLLLDELAKMHGPRKVVRLDSNQLLSTPTKNQSTIQTAFQQAISAQPSLILIDQLDHIASASDVSTTTTAASLAAALDSIRDTNVLAIATARSASTLPSLLLTRQRFETIIELPIPDIKARIDILAKLLLPHCNNTPTISQDIASLTHGFTGDDLARLCIKALQTAAIHQLDAEQNQTVTSRDENSVEDRLLDLSISDFQLALTKVRPSALREVILEPPRVNFDDIGGSESLKARFDEIIEWPTRYRDAFAALPQRKPTRGILLYGPPGCSKTMTAQAVASTYGWNFIAVRGAELISMYVGESERAIRDIFRKARQAAPTIIFFDEIDSIATSRSGAADASKSLNVVTTLLNEMDGFEAAKDILVLAATNQPQSLDPAILRPGRFDTHLYLGPPDAHARQQILRICSKNTPGSDQIDYIKVTSDSDGMSGAELRNAWSIACNQALRRMIVSGEALRVTTEDIISGIAETGKRITEQMLQTYIDFSSID